MTPVIRMQMSSRRRWTKRVSNDNLLQHNELRAGPLYLKLISDTLVSGWCFVIRKKSRSVSWSWSTAVTLERGWDERGPVNSWRHPFIFITHMDTTCAGAHTWDGQQAAGCHGDPNYKQTELPQVSPQGRGVKWKCQILQLSQRIITSLLAWHLSSEKEPETDLSSGRRGTGQVPFFVMTLIYIYVFDIHMVSYPMVSIMERHAKENQAM